MPLRFSLNWDVGIPCTVLVSIYAEDGTVAVSHGGVEIGQGINTKVSFSVPFFFSYSLILSLSSPVPLLSLHFLPLFLFPLFPSCLTQVAQVAAKTLGIPLEMIKVKPSMTFTNPNGNMTASSVTSELNCLVSFHQLWTTYNVITPLKYMVGYNSGLSTVKWSNPTNPQSAPWPKMAWLDSKVLWWEHWFVSKILVRLFLTHFLFSYLFMTFFQCMWRDWTYLCLQCIWSSCFWSWSRHPNWTGSDTQSWHPLWLWTKVKIDLIAIGLISHVKCPSSLGFLTL